MVLVNGEHWKVLIKDTASVPGYDISLCKCVICLLSWGHFWRHQTQTLFFFQIGFRSDKLRIMNLVWSFILPQPQDVPELLMLLIAYFSEAILYPTFIFFLRTFANCDQKVKRTYEVWHFGAWAHIWAYGQAFWYSGTCSGMRVCILVSQACIRACRWTFWFTDTRLGILVPS